VRSGAGAAHMIMATGIGHAATRADSRCENSVSAMPSPAGYPDITAGPHGRINNMNAEGGWCWPMHSQLERIEDKTRPDSSLWRRLPCARVAVRSRFLQHLFTASTPIHRRHLKRRCHACGPSWRMPFPRALRTDASNPLSPIWITPPSAGSRAAHGGPFLCVALSPTTHAHFDIYELATRGAPARAKAAFGQANRALHASLGDVPIQMTTPSVFPTPSWDHPETPAQISAVTI